MSRRYSGQSAWAWGGALLVSGFAAISLSWKGAAATLFIPTQVAYLVSGGIIGLGLIALGAVVIDTHVSRLLRADARYDVARLVDEAAQSLAATRARIADRVDPAP